MKRTKIVIWSWALCLALIAGASAQETAGAGLAAPLGEGTADSALSTREYDLTRKMSKTPADPSNYLLRAGDQVRVRVLTGEEENIELQSLLARDGTVALPWVDPLDLSGLTLAQASVLVQDAYRRIYRRAFAQVALSELGTYQISLTGNYRDPGLYRVLNGTTLYSLLLALNLDTDGERRLMTLERLGMPEESTDLLAQAPEYTLVGEFDALDFSVRGAFENDVFLQAWDRITLLEPEVVVQIDRGVPRTGRYAVLPGETLLDILELAGEMDATADLQNTMLTRYAPDGTPVVNYIDLQDIMAIGAAFELQNRDRIMLLPYRQNIYVLGEVNLPGLVQLQPGENVFEALSRAGGTTSGAHAKFVTVVRPPRLYADRLEPHQIFTIDIRSLIKPKDQDGIPVQIMPGDMVFVPSKGDRISGSTILTAISAALGRLRL